MKPVHPAAGQVWKYKGQPKKVVLLLWNEREKCSEAFFLDATYCKVASMMESSDWEYVS